MSGEKVGFRGRMRDAWAGIRGRGPTALAHSWDAFNEREQASIVREILKSGSAYQPERMRMRLGTERSILASL